MKNLKVTCSEVSAAWCHTVLQMLLSCRLLISLGFPKRGCQSLSCPTAELPTPQKTLLQVTHSSSHTMKTKVLSWQLWSHLPWAYRWINKLILQLLSTVICIKLVCIRRWRASAWAAVWEQSFLQAALQPCHPSTGCFSHLIFPQHIPDAESRWETAFYQHFSAWRIFCSELLPALLM